MICQGLCKALDIKKRNEISKIWYPLPLRPSANAISQPQQCRHFGPGKSLLWGLSCALQDVQRHPSLNPLYAGSNLFHPQLVVTHKKFPDITRSDMKQSKSFPVDNQSNATFSTLISPTQRLRHQGGCISFNYHYIEYR